jgi:hypothetical protein
MTKMIYGTLNRYWARFWVTTLLFFATPVPLLLAEDSPTPTCKVIERACRVCMNNVCSSVGIACQPTRLVCPDDEALIKYYESIFKEMDKNEASQKDGTNSSQSQ